MVLPSLEMRKMQPTGRPRGLAQGVSESVGNNADLRSVPKRVRYMGTPTRDSLRAISWLARFRQVYPEKKNWQIQLNQKSFPDSQFVYCPLSTTNSMSRSPNFMTALQL